MTKMKLFSLMIILSFSTMSFINEDTGLNIFVQQKCMNCHLIEKKGIVSKSKNPVPLDELTLKNSEDLKKYLLKEFRLNDKSHPIKFKGTVEELDTLSNWILK